MALCLGPRTHSQADLLHFVREALIIDGLNVLIFRRINALTVIIAEYGK
jgi:hypothetical protein